MVYIYIYIYIYIYVYIPYIYIYIYTMIIYIYIYIVYVIESAAYGVVCTSCLFQKPERARYERVRAFDRNNECI